MTGSNTTGGDGIDGGRDAVLPDAPASAKRPAQDKPAQTGQAPGEEAPADGDTIAELGDAVGGPA